MLCRLYALNPAPAPAWGSVALLAWAGMILLLLVCGIGPHSTPQLHPLLVPLIGLGLYSTARAPATAIVSHLLGNRVMVHLGQVSYSIYLWHGLALLLVQHVSPLQDWAGLGAGLLLTLLLSEAAYWGIERPWARPATGSVPSGRRGQPRRM